MHFATINDVNLHYQVIGAPESKPTIVFANSLGTDFRIWRDVIVRLVGDYSIVTYDKRGHGLSDLGDSQTMTNHLEDLAGLMDHLGIQSAIICGVSVGGLIAQGLHATRPDLVGALILCNTGTKIGTDELWNMRIEMVETKGISEIADGVLARWFTKGYRDDNPADVAGYANMLTRTPAKGYTGTSAAIRDTDFTEQAAEIKVPTICIAGDQDGATPPELVKAMAKTIPNAFYEEIKDCGHIPSIECGQYLTDVMTAFMAKLTRE
ncbi:MAG: 3-oxoadipate enol-lactonase [Rhizobiaceae bacterium]|nr:3-oxoadipate enol-lactonase [Rhizobiaceae bacterium]